MYLNPKIVHILSAINFEAPLISLVADAKSNSFTKHHLVALHVVVHAVFQLGQESFPVDYIEVYQFFCCDLNSYITFDEKDEALDPQFMILLPGCFFGNSVFFLSEK